MLIGRRTQLIAEIKILKGLIVAARKRAKTTAIATAPSSFKTEDTGKIFEYAICLAIGTPFQGSYKYSVEEATTLAPRIAALLGRVSSVRPAFTHTAGRGGRYDFTAPATEDGTPPLHLSAKTTKRGVGMIAPQVIGQAQPAKFCEVLGIPYMSSEGNVALKRHIQENITALLPALAHFAFDCPTLFYNKGSDQMCHVVVREPIPWREMTFSWSRPWDSWTNSSSLMLTLPGAAAPVRLMEFQFHTTRTNMAVRWCYETFLAVFKPHLDIQVG
jgi:hypothetical protein